MRRATASGVIFGAVLVAIPLIVMALWFASGREVLTKRTRVVSVSIHDTLFDETTTVEEFVPGPIAGYYVGLDLVVASVLLCAAIALIWWISVRRR